MFWVATPVPSVTVLAPLLSNICPLVLVHVTVAPATGFPLASVALTEIGWKYCKVAETHSQAAWPLPDCTARCATADVCASANEAPDRAISKPKGMRVVNL